MLLVLNPEVKLRHDIDRAILFSVNPADSFIDPVFQYLYPQQAITLSLFDGTRDLIEIKHEVEYLFNINFEKASEFVDTLLVLPVNSNQTLSYLILDASLVDIKRVRKYNPKDFIVPIEKVNMSDTRCRIPCTLTILPTMRCVTDCIYCYAKHHSFLKRKEIGLPIIKKILKEAKDFKIETIVFSGGDFFSRNDAFEILEFMFTEGLYPNIPTKFPLSYEKIQRLTDMGLTTIQISIDAFSPKIIDQLMRVEGYGKKILKTFDLLAKAGIWVRTNTVLTSINIKDALNLAKYLAQFSNVFRSNFNIYTRSLYKHDDKLFCSEEDILDFEKELIVIQENYPKKNILFSGMSHNPYEKDTELRKINFNNRPFCTANRRGLVVLPDGIVTICEELYDHEAFVVGDIYKNTLLEIWNSPKALSLAYPDKSHFKDSLCSACLMFEFCNRGLGRCIRDTLKAYGIDKPTWPDPKCYLAPVGNRLQ